jgi:hypothetical protein
MSGPNAYFDAATAAWVDPDAEAIPFRRPLDRVGRFCRRPIGRGLEEPFTAFLVPRAVGYQARRRAGRGARRVPRLPPPAKRRLTSQVSLRQRWPIGVGPSPNFANLPTSRRRRFTGCARLAGHAGDRLGPGEEQSRPRRGTPAPSSVERLSTTTCSVPRGGDSEGSSKY